jgi:hypothetical protein
MSNTPPDVRRDAERAHDKQTEFFNQVNKATIDTSFLALRTSVLINGAAAVAVLAFLGSLASSDKVPLTQLASIANSLKSFAWGVVAAALAMLSAYLTNYTITCRLVTQERTFKYPYLKNTGWSVFWTILSLIFLVISFFLGLGSIAFFVYGTVGVGKSVAQFGDSESPPPNLLDFNFMLP